MVKLVENLSNTIMMKDLEDGQIAIIVEDFSDYKGRIVQRVGTRAITLGMPSGQGWEHGDAVTLKVRILTIGETLTIE